LRDISPQTNDIQRCSTQYQEDLMIAMERAGQAHDKDRQEVPAKDAPEAPQSKRTPGKLSKLLLGKSDETKNQTEEMQIAKRQHKEYIQELLESFSSHDFLTPLKQGRRKRQIGTADWLFKTRNFDDWINGHGAPVLWCSGKSEFRL
jgi:hypothetical protein